jgi:predicted DCC family thiol-disulfide oxidoreductase YuxK
MLQEQQVECPYCGEFFDTLIDLTQGNQVTIEDCYVCCRPIEFLIESDGASLIRIVVGSGDETLY